MKALSSMPVEYQKIQIHKAENMKAMLKIKL